MKVLVTGSSGLIGSALTESLGAHGHEVIRLLRRNVAEGSPSWNPENGIMDLADVQGYRCSHSSGRRQHSRGPME